MKNYIVILALALATHAQAATVNWSAGIDHGFSSANGTNLPAGSLVRLGWFRDPVAGTPLSDTQIQAAAGSKDLLAARFVSAGSSAIGQGVSGAAAHFSATSAVDTAALSLTGKQMYLWVLNASTLEAATEQAILYWDITDASNPDGAPIRPQLRWGFPAQQPVPGNSSIDLTDLTGPSALATGARLVVGSYPVGVSALTAAPNFGLAVISSELTINTSATLATAVRSLPYTQALVATGGSEPMVWTVSSGSLPDGLSLVEATGVIQGTPTTVGQSSFTVQVEASGGVLASKQFNLQVAAAALTIVSPSALEDGLLDQPYPVALQSDGGSTPHSWSHTSGNLPPGVILEPNGTFSGTFTALGLFQFETTLTDTTGQRIQKTFTVNVTLTPSIIGAASLVPGVKGIAYSHQFVLTDTRPYAWSITAGALPPGLTLSSNGLLKGKPTSVGTGPFSFTVQAAGAGGITTTRAFTLSILATNVAPTLQVPNFPETIVGNSGFKHRVIASPNPSTIYAGGLPPGLVINATTGWISGNPTRAGVYVVSLQAKNAAGSSAVEYAVFRVKALPAGAVGSYNALVTPVQEVNFLLGGRIDLTTTLAGNYSLTLTQGSLVVKKTGVLTTDAASLSPRIITTIGNLKLNLTLDSANNNINGTLAAVNAAGTPIPAAVSGWRQTWSTVAGSDAFAGFYNTGLELTSHRDIQTVPQGTGVIRVHVGRTGTTFATGTTADGQLVTAAGILSGDGRVLIHTRLNANLGILQGALRVISAASVIDNTIAGTVIWGKSNSITRTYPSAFGPLTLSAEGGWMGNSDVVVGNVVGVTGGKVQGLPVAGQPCAITFTKGGIEGAAVKPNIDPFTFTHFLDKDGLPAIQANLPLAGTSLNQTKLGLTMWAKIGFFVGNFELLDAGRKRQATFKGAVVRTADDELKAVGYFLLPKLPQLGQVGRPETLSGKVVITQPNP